MPITITVTIDERTGEVVRTTHSTHSAPPTNQTDTSLDRPPVEELIKPDKILFLEDNKWYTTLTRPLKRYNMTWETYLKKWDLPPDFPKVAASYSSLRSEALKRRYSGFAKPLGIRPGLAIEN